MIASESTDSSSSFSAAGKQQRLCLFLGNNKIVIRRSPLGVDVFASGVEEIERAAAALRCLEAGCVPVRVDEEGGRELFFACLEGMDVPKALEAEGWEAVSLLAFYDLAAGGADLGPWVDLLRRNAIRIPYLYLSANDYIYRFRAERERNRKVYQVDASSVALYHSALCDAIKAVKRGKERSATSPAACSYSVCYRLQCP